MKKTVKSLFLVVLMATLLLGLTACTNKNKLVATKDGEDDFFGKYKETVEISFKDDKAETIVMTRELEDKEIADKLQQLIDSVGTEALGGMDIKVEDNKVIMTLNPEEFAAEEDLDDEDLSRDSLKKELEEDGYKVK